MVSGNPIPSRRRGTTYSRLSTRSLIREASANSTTASVASASVRTVALVGATVTSSITSGPSSSPIRTNAIAGVNDVSVSRRDTPATASRAAAMIGSSHFTRSQDRFADADRHPPNQMTRTARPHEARRLPARNIDRLLGLGNDLGLLSEEYDVK